MTTTDSKTARGKLALCRKVHHACVYANGCVCVCVRTYACESRGDGSKDPIVEMRTEEERGTNLDEGSPVNEPNETTPLTEPE